jgi:hypothetical protein
VDLDYLYTFLLCTVLFGRELCAAHTEVLRSYALLPSGQSICINDASAWKVSFFSFYYLLMIYNSKNS